MKQELFNDGTYIIEINTLSNKYELSELDGDKTFHIGDYKTYQEAQEGINRNIKDKKKKIAPIECLYNESSRREEYMPAKITSIKKSSYGLYARISYGDNKRREIDSDFLLKNTEKTRKINAEIMSLCDKLAQLKKEREKFSEVELIKHFD